MLYRNEKAVAHTGARSQESVPILIPRPKSADFSGETFLLPYAGRIVEYEECGDSTNVYARQLADDIEQATGIAWDIAKGRSWRAIITLRINAAIAAQGYHLRIASDGIIVEGGDEEGLRNGVQTLRQVIRQFAPVMPVGDIEDLPDYTTRSYYLDVTRGRVPTMQWLKEWADRLCLYKYNQLQLYIEHTFMFDGMSETWRGTSPLTPTHIMEFDEYCAARGIELVPSMSTFGHHYMALRTKELRGLSEFPQDADRRYSFVERMEHHTLNVTDDEAFAFSTRLIEQYLELFRTKKFNICADETFDLGKGASKALADEIGVGTMYAQYVTRLCEYLSERGREPMMWGDIAVQMPQILPRLPKNVTLLNWQYDAAVTEEKVRLVAQSGARQIVCPAVQCWNSLLPRLDDAWHNISRMALYGAQYGAVGILITDWGDYGHVNDPHMAVPGMIYGAQCSWNAASSDDDADAMNAAVSTLEYGDASGMMLSALAKTTREVSFGWDDAVRYVELDAGNGMLNTDVLHSIWNLKDEQRAWLRDSDMLAQARERYLIAFANRIGRAESANAALDGIERRTCAALAGARGEHAMMMRALRIAFAGQRLLNLTGLHLLQQVDVATGLDDDADGGITDIELARALEMWGEQYATAWRSVSEESELRRVLSTVWRCADALR